MKLLEGKKYFWEKRISRRILSMCSLWNATFYTFRTTTIVPCLKEQGLIVPLFQWLWGDILSVSPLPDVRMRYFWSNGNLANAIKQHFFYTSAIWMSHFWKLTYGRVIRVPSCSFHLSVLSKLFSLFYYSCLMFLLPAVTCSWSSKFMQDQEVAGNHMVN